MGGTGRICASQAGTSLSSLSYSVSLSIPRAKFWSTPRIAFLSRYSVRNPAVRFSSTVKDRTFEVSWLSLDDSAHDDCGGWAVIELPSPVPKQQTGLPKVLALSIGTLAVVLLAAMFHFSSAGKGFKFPYGNLSQLLHNNFGASASNVSEDGVAEPDQSLEEIVESDISKVDLSDPPNELAAKQESTRPHIVPIAVDSVQSEALALLKKFKIIEDDVKAGDLCSRREYARWSVRASSMFERNTKHKIVPTFTLSGSTITAFDDVPLNDPDFKSIQALAEAGILLSKLSENYSLEDQGEINFNPGRFISRGELIDWRGQLEYDFASAGDMEMSNLKLDILDTKEINLQTSPGLFMDLLAGDRSLHRKVFGQVMRLQPNKPATKAQAAVILTSGHMYEAIRIELLRIEAEESSRQAAKEEIGRELLDQGEINKIWDAKMENEKIYGTEAKRLLLEAYDELERQKSHHEKESDECLIKKAALNCQRQLLNGLQLEVNEMTERVGSEREELIAEEETLPVVLRELNVKKEGILDAKSWLQAEIEALRILRSWVEDEARKNGARANVLEEVGGRWRWNGHEQV